MVRIATVKKAKDERQKATQYIKAALIYPSAFLGLISLILGYGALIYLMIKGGFLANIVYSSFVLLGLGVFLGWLQYRYQRFLFDSYPEYYAGKQRQNESIRSGQTRKVGVVEKPSHRGRKAVPYVYLAGYAAAITTIVIYARELNSVSAIFLLLAGLYNARFLSWKRKLGV